MRTYVLKALAVLFAILFIISAGLQYNDPDPVLWYVVYGIAALISLLYVFDRLPLWVAVVIALVFVAGGLISWPAKFEGFTIGGGDIRNIEEGREAFGLFITALIMLIYAFSLRKGKKTV
ncbi:transmembrane 220 family protein [Robertkochia flava]|uniref:transmembrane 220 family protein n=1 Tax=Robertkochia flava TaxID=3447986 RepID=UPI001CCB2BD0|nr:transmembrane 220 family protein [Robertkochia marina]